MVKKTKKEGTAWLVEHRGGKTFSLPAKITKPEHLKNALSPMAWKILTMLAEKPMYPKEIAKKLKLHEQKVYYHIRNMEKAGLIEKIHEQTKLGAVAKIYSVTDSVFALTLKPLEESAKIFTMKREHRRFLEPFIENGRFNALVIMGSPDPHGPRKVQARDGPPTAQLTLFLGSFINYMPEKSIKVDTEVRDEDLKNNLIILGGPGPNAIMRKVNKKLPIQFKHIREEGAFFTEFYSSLSGNTYNSEANGIVVKTKNPFDKNKEMLVIAGMRRKGTNAAILS
ncbi:MAG: helix-turn-helix domain-containing protein, partial [Candidatus Aenigmatarchaeota archaeon]